MTAYLQGLAIRGYRGIGAEIQKLSPFKRFNFFIGANNVGKSAVLSFLTDWLKVGTSYQQPSLFHGQQPIKEFGPLDLYRGGTSTKVEGAVAFSGETFRSSVYEREPKLKLFHDTQMLERLFAAFCDEKGFVWYRMNLDRWGVKSLFYTLEPQNAVGSGNDWQSLWQLLNPQSYGGDVNTWISDVTSRFLHAQAVAFPQCVLIPAIRQIGPKGEDLKDHSGRGLIDRLAELQNPSLETRHDRTIFDRINRFLQDVTDDRNAMIEIPHDREHILVHMDERVLPLEALGTGIHEVIMIAAFCTLNDEKIVCIEEPEIHLHPLLQRKLVRYLQRNTESQYFIATHSAVFIDTPESAVFHVTKSPSQAIFQESVLRRDRLSICINLGYRASDILQSNCVIWVEGPSDRIYIRWWVSALSPELTEGIHYSIMFYGGRLLSHLSAQDEEITEFIDLRAINQHLAIVIDSDRKTARASINETKQRIIREFNQKPGLAWLTKGREIENYIDHKTLQLAVEDVYQQSYIRAAGGETFDHALYFFRKNSKNGKEELFCDADKVKVAKAVVRNAPDFAVLDLKRSISALVEMIQDANA